MLSLTTGLIIFETVLFVLGLLNGYAQVESFNRSRLFIPFSVIFVLNLYLLIYLFYAKVGRRFSEVAWEPSWVKVVVIAGLGICAPTVTLLFTAIISCTTGFDFARIFGTHVWRMNFLLFYGSYSIPAILALKLNLSRKNNPKK